MTDETDRVGDMLQAISRRLADEGKLIEAGWLIHRKMVLEDVRLISDIDRYKDTWDASAQHLFSCIFAMMEGGDDETLNDLRRMDNINAEVLAIFRRLNAKYQQ
jgi:hypothetical protein